MEDSHPHLGEILDLPLDPFVTSNVWTVPLDPPKHYVKILSVNCIGEPPIELGVLKKTRLSGENTISRTLLAMFG